MEDKEQIAEETAHALPKAKRTRKPKLKVMTLVEPKVEVPAKTPAPTTEKPKTISVGEGFKSYTINDALAKALGPGHWEVVSMETFKAALRRREGSALPESQSAPVKA